MMALQRAFPSLHDSCRHFQGLDPFCRNVSLLLPASICSKLWSLNKQEILQDLKINRTIIYIEYSLVSTINFNTFHLKAVKPLPLLYVWTTLEGPYLHFFSSIRHGKYRNFMHPALRQHLKFIQATEYIQWKPAPIFCVNKIQIKTILLAPSLKSGKIIWQELRVIFSMPSSSWPGRTHVLFITTIRGRCVMSLLPWATLPSRPQISYENKFSTKDRFDLDTLTAMPPLPNLKNKRCKSTCTTGTFCYLCVKKEKRHNWNAN